jgi:hypothetical protein
MVKLSPVTVATQLHALEAEEKRIAVRKEELRKQLFDGLKAQGVVSVKLKNGTHYILNKRHTLEPLMTMKDQAMSWALEHNAVKIDTAKSFQILRHQLDMPKFFRVKTTEYLTVRRPGAVNDDDHDS